MSKNPEKTPKSIRGFRLCWESRKKALLFATVFLAFCSFQAAAQLPSSTITAQTVTVEGTSSAAMGSMRGASDRWTALLQACVRGVDNDHSTAVDYDCFKTRQGELDSYLEKLASVTEDTLLAQDANTQLAFLINAYNAWTVKLILNNWPGVESIRDLGSLLRSPWKKSFIPLLGRTVSLDDIEHGMIREKGRFDDPRIHFAVNCASVGCPALRNEAYRGTDIDRQLEEQTQSFLADPSRNRFRGDSLEVSSIFKWYRGDFEKEWRGGTTLEQFLGRYSTSLSLTEQQVSALINGDIDLEFLDYDWRLNSTAK